MSDKIENGLDAKRISRNIVFSVIAFVLNMIISFFLTPHITSNLGSEAYGFVKLSTDFVSYASLVSIALNSMASRFIMLERERNNSDKASSYYSSILISNVILAMFLIVPAVIITLYLDRVLNIPEGLVIDAKLTFALAFLSFLMELAFSTFGNCYFLSNRIDASSIVSAVANIVKVLCIMAMFVAFSPNIVYLSLGGLIASSILVLFNLYYHHKLVPDIRFDKKKVKWKIILEVLSSGIWNAITRLSQIFSSGLDLLVTNVILGATNMGYLSVAKTVPNLVATFNSTVANAFSPNMMMLYAKGNMDQLKSATKTAMRFMCLFVTIPTAILITMGQEFFMLWVPEQPSQLINVLSILTIINSCVTGPMQPLYQIFTITNKIKQSSIVMIIYGFVSILITFVCLKLTNLGLYAVAGVSLVGSLIVALGYHLPFSAKYIGLPWYTFFPEIGKSILTLVVQCVPGMIINFLIPLQSSWLLWFAGAICSAIVGLVINMFLVLNAQERRTLMRMVTNKFIRR